MLVDGGTSESCQSAEISACYSRCAGTGWKKPSCLRATWFESTQGRLYRQTSKVNSSSIT